MQEVWKNINGYENTYMISNFGKVKSLERFVPHYKGGYRLKKERIMTITKNNDGYGVVTLTKNNVKHQAKVHQLVVLSFIDCKYKTNKKHVINHKNLNKFDNNLDNLEIVTHRENSNKNHLKSSSKYVGVSYRKDNSKWRSDIYIDGKLKSLGCYNTEIEASNAYQKELKKINNVFI